jgi:hypothetical protein
MIKAVKENHPKNEHNNFYECGEACCVDSGFHCCCKTTEKSHFDKFGVGVSLYFKFMKYLMGFFLIFTIISLPIMYFSVRGNEI